MRNGEDLSAGELEAAQQAIGYPFRNRELLKACFTHRSYSNVFGGKDNERLEFLGDAVLELAVTEELFRSDENREGVLTERRQQLVSQSALEAACDRASLRSGHRGHLPRRRHGMRPPLLKALSHGLPDGKL